MALPKIVQLLRLVLRQPAENDLYFAPAKAAAIVHLLNGLIGAVLREQVPEATMAEAALSDSQPCVVAWAGRLVIIITGRPVQYGEGRVEVRVDGSSASMRQGSVSCVYAPVPFALTVDTLARDA